MLAEWFGYVISGRLDLHKIGGGSIVRPDPGRQGLISRILGRLGPGSREQVRRPNAVELSGDFGWRRCIGKARGGRSRTHGSNGRGAHVVVERLL